MRRATISRRSRDCGGSRRSICARPRASPGMRTKSRSYNPDADSLPRSRPPVIPCLAPIGVEPPRTFDPGVLLTLGPSPRSPATSPGQIPRDSRFCNRPRGGQHLRSSASCLHLRGDGRRSSGPALGAETPSRLCIGGRRTVSARARGSRLRRPAPASPAAFSTFSRGIAPAVSRRDHYPGGDRSLHAGILEEPRGVVGDLHPDPDGRQRLYGRRSVARQRDVAGGAQPPGSRAVSTWSASRRSCSAPRSQPCSTRRRGSTTG
jgi:hypothetical protein